MDKQKLGGNKNEKRYVGCLCTDMLNKHIMVRFNLFVFYKGIVISVKQVGGNEK